MAMPDTIAATKRNTVGLKVSIAVRAGPGQKPAMPQPMPNRAAPLSNLESMSLALGSWKPASKSECLRFNIQ